MKLHVLSEGWENSVVYECRMNQGGERAVGRPAHVPGATDGQKLDLSVYTLAYRVRMTFLSVFPTLVLGIFSVIIYLSGMAYRGIFP